MNSSLSESQLIIDDIIGQGGHLSTKILYFNEHIYAFLIQSNTC